MDWTFNAWVYLFVFISTVIITVFNGVTSIQLLRISEKLQRISADLRGSISHLAITIGVAEGRVFQPSQGGRVLRVGRTVSVPNRVQEDRPTGGETQVSP
ncbi:putative ssDNA-dsDNA regulatory protein [Tomato apical leaf curl virus]|uniref:Putative ssDNA-dsDNA regulatory protein n=1 Tax=Tomato apical leaf curl virus TaxID=2060142 RepID=A0A2H4Z9X4_9GEMI|nr:putative ssDNA-dsDNA regulatory protein [Tomato apical leaf curl virus]YP_010797593.1 putative ssDNA-dsDNA regulatory protein [Tomato apical leaf curl virus]AUF71983.1 putative ssDNA-dsDNA regulatory protein [Tomato apical leaf curl virus]AUF71989.1 putative ssDNA-dsDNA regulatory protein [Tomato apical leaf curl virus]AUF71995.1 putative ssDNA-dsDNA regulatory protein [Tomato apical leaf curl virus]